MKKSFFYLAMAIITLSVCFSGSLIAEEHYQKDIGFDVFDLDTLASDESITYCLNDDGLVVCSYKVLGEKMFFLWSKEQSITLIDLPTNAMPNKINKVGQIAGNYIVAGNSRGFLWDSCIGFVDIGTLGGANTWVTDLNNLGQVIGHSETGNISQLDNKVKEKHAFVFHQALNKESVNMIKDLGSLSGDLGFMGDESIAISINDYGEIVGASNVVWFNNGKRIKSPLQGVIWKNENIECLLVLPNFEKTIGLAIDNLGNVLVTKNDSLFFLEADNHQENKLPFGNVYKARLTDSGKILLNNATYYDSKHNFNSKQNRYSVTLGDVLDLTNNFYGFWNDISSFTDINSKGEISGTAVTKFGDRHSIIMKPRGKLN